MSPLHAQHLPELLQLELAVAQQEAHPLRLLGCPVQVELPPYLAPQLLWQEAKEEQDAMCQGWLPGNQRRQRRWVGAKRPAVTLSPRAAQSWAPLEVRNNAR